jgi:hypothetical protein
MAELTLAQIDMHSTATDGKGRTSRREKRTFASIAEARAYLAEKRAKMQQE